MSVLFCILQNTQIHEVMASFSEALNAAKDGKMVTRNGWNGKGMFVFMRPSDIIPMPVVVNVVKSLPESVKNFFKSKDENETPSEQGLGSVKFTAYLCMYASDGSIVNGWLASQTDMLADDWVVL